MPEQPETSPEPASPGQVTAGPVPSAVPPPPDQPYQALYRRYRPQRFADVRGQDHVTRALRNAVREERVAHAYLFSGPRGTGKTSTARILAMALNCESPVGGEPDGTCTSCTSVRSGASMDVFELDAASNRKLDEMRDLLSRVALGTPGRWKVYIIDEVHQLTADAASALLKTLEEPPSHVVFVLATTDPQKVLPTILSRTQHFEFHLLDGDLLTGLLRDINRDADLGLSAEAVNLAVERGRGSARDAESALEQLAASGGSEDDVAPLSELVEHLAQRDVSLTLQSVARAVAAGREPRRLGNGLVDYLRNAFLANQAPSLVLLPSTATAKLGEQAQQMGLPFLVRCMETVGQALVEMRDSVDPRVTLEVALIRLAAPAADASPAALLDRIERLERSFAGRDLAPGTPPAIAPASPAPASPAPASPAPASPAPASPVPSGPTLTTPTLPQGSAPGPPSSPAAGPAQAKVALGAFLKAGSGTPGSPPGPLAATERLPAAAAEPGAPDSPSAPDSPPASTSAPASPSAPGSASGAVPPPPATSSLVGPTSGTASGPSALPTRDDLTKAWGDTVLGQLTRPAQVYMASGRFTEVTGGTAIFALPDRGLVERAANFVPEAERALAAHFGTAVPLRLAVDRGADAKAPPEPPPAENESYDLEDLNDFTDAPAVPTVPVEQRILQAFPGSVLDS